MQPRVREIEPIEAVENLVQGLKADGLSLLHGGDRACYVPKLDTIKMPDKAVFHSAEDYHSTLLHEASHATGAKKRLDRLGIFGNLTSMEAYAREELRAELASAMLGAELGIRQGEYHVENHAAYVASWLQALRNDQNEIFKAASAAQKIADWLKTHAVTPEVVSTEDVTSTPVESVPADSLAPRRRVGMRMG